MYDLDFSLLPEVRISRLFMGLPANFETDLYNLKLYETLDRLKGACRFLDKVSAEKESWLNRAYIRAGLSEFRSAKQALLWDLSDRTVYDPTMSKNPLVHLAFRLRRVAVYVENLSTYSSPTSVSIFFDGENHTANINILLIRDLANSLKKETLDKYHKDDIANICDWFNACQNRIGAGATLSLGVMLYSQELFEYYSNKLPN